MSHCPFEHSTVRAARSGVWEPALRDHARGCPVCAEVALVGAFLGRQAEAAAAEAELPPAAFLWWRIELRRRQELGARATRPISLLRGILGAALAAGAAVVSWTRAGAIGSWLADLASGWDGWEGMRAAPLAAPSPDTALLTAAALALSLVLLAVYSAWAEG